MVDIAGTEAPDSIAGPVPEPIQPDPEGIDPEADPAAPAAESRLDVLIDLADRDIDQVYNKVVARRSASTGYMDSASELAQSIIFGPIKSGFAFYDFAVGGEPNYEDKFWWRQAIEHQQTYLDRKSAVNAVASDISQFVASWIGVGKIAKLGSLATGLKAVNRTGRITSELARGSAAGSIGFDPHEERVSDLIQSSPLLANPVTSYLASDLHDSEAEGRLKTALEGVGLDAALMGATALVLKAVKLRRAGKAEEAEAATDQASTIISQDREAAAAGAATEPNVVPPPATSAESLTETPTQAAPAAGDAAAPPRETFSGIDDDIPFFDDPLERAERERRAASRPASTKTSVAGDPRDAELADLGTAWDPSSAEIREASKPSGAAAERTGAPGPEQSLRQEEPAQSSASSSSTTAPQARTPAAPVRPVMEFTDEEVHGVIKAAEEDAEAIANAGGTRDLAELQGHNFGAMLIPWRKMRGSEDLQAYAQRIAQAKEAEFAQIKGGDVLSDARLGRMVNRFADRFATDPATTMGVLSTAGRQAGQMAAQMEAGWAVTGKLFDAAYDLSTKLNDGMWRQAGFTSEEEALAEAKRLMGMMSEAAAASRSILSNAGRTLRRARFGLSKEALERLDQMDPRAAVQMMAATRGDPQLIAQVTTPTLWRRAGEVFEHLAVNGPLWLYPTHVVNFATSLINLGLRPTEKLIGSAILKAAGKQGADTVLRRAQLEYRYTAAAVGDGIKGAVDAFKAGDSVLSPHEFFQGENITAQNTADLPRNIDSLTDIIAWSRFATGMPTRLLGSSDEMMKTIRYRAVVMAKAADEGERAGLAGQALTDFIRKELGDAFDSSGRATRADALQEARVSTFTDQLTNPLGVHLQRAVDAIPALRAVFTYVRTPAKVLGYGVRLTPGLQLLHGDFRRAITGSQGVEAQAQAMGQMALGSLVAIGSIMVAATGRVTGGGPSDPDLRRELEKDGWKPYSLIIFNDDGSKTYIPIGRFDPLGMVFGISADLVDIAQHPGRHDDAQEAFTAFAMALAQNVNNRTFTTNLATTMDAIMQADRSMGRWLGNVAESALPFSSLMRGLNPDPYLREARTMIDHLRDRLPGSSGMPPRRDAWGDPITVYKGLWSSGQGDDVDAEMQRLIMETGRGLTQIGAYSSGGDIDLRDLPITLEDGTTTTAYDRLQETMARPGGGQRSLKETLSQLIQMQSYQDLPDGYADVRGSKLNALAKVRDQYREAAMERLKREFPSVREALYRRQVEVGAAIRANQRERAESEQAIPSEIRRGLDALGIPLTTQPSSTLTQ